IDCNFDTLERIVNMINYSIIPIDICLNDMSIFMHELENFGLIKIYYDILDGGIKKKQIDNQIYLKFYNEKHFINTEFKRLDFIGIEFHHGSFKNCVFDGSKLIDVVFEGVVMINCKFNSCTFNNVNFPNCILTNVEFCSKEIDDTDVNFNNCK